MGTDRISNFNSTGYLFQYHSAVTFSVIGSICVHVPMSLRARISAPDEWHRIKVVKSDWDLWWLGTLVTSMYSLWLALFLLVHQIVIYAVWWFPVSLQLCCVVWSLIWVCSTFLVFCGLWVCQLCTRFKFVEFCAHFASSFSNSSWQAALQL